MAIFDTSFMLILVSIIFTSITPLSTCHKVTDNEIKHLCSKTSNSNVCYKLLKSDHRTSSNVDAKGLVRISVDIVSAEAHKIHSHLMYYAKTTHDVKMRNKYESCATHYHVAIRNLEVVKKDLFSSAYNNIRVRVNDASDEIKRCERVFGEVSNDQANIKKSNKNFEFLLSIVEVASNDLMKKN